MTNSPKICFGMVLFNNDKYLLKAINSILSQTYQDFQVVACDDCSTDNSETIVRDYASRDERITYLRNEQRLGMILNKRKAFLEARKRGADYFAWASDHDVWHPKWLNEHVEVLDKQPDVVLTYPLTLAIGPGGERLSDSPNGTLFDTFGMSKLERTRAVCNNMTGAGNMVYGLYRASTLEKCGVFPYCTMPDRLLLLKLSVYGSFKQVNKILWYRRYLKRQQDFMSEVERQCFTLFAVGKAPWYCRFPILTQTIKLVSDLSLFPQSHNYSNAWLGFYMAYLHFRRKRRFVRRELSWFISRNFQPQPINS